jgi:choline-sulfatase
MATLLTGLTALTHGVVESQTVLPSGIPTLAEALSRLGYHNVAFIGNPNVGPRFGFTRGINDVREIFASADGLVQPARQWLSHSRQEPFFLWLHLIDPHIPYAPPPPYDRLFCDDALYRQQEEVRLPFGSTRGDIVGYARAAERDRLGDYVCAYDGEVRFADEQIGLFLQEIEEQGLSARTLIIATADHGESFGEDGNFFSHGFTANDHLARVPLMFAHPLLRHRIIDDAVGHVDIAASALGVVTGTVTRFGEGRNLFQTTATPPPVLTVAGTPRFRTLAITDGAWKLVLEPRQWRESDIVARLKLRAWPRRFRNVPLRHRSYAIKLYDLRVDPEERNNLAGEGREDERRLRDLLFGLIDRGSSSVVWPLDPGQLDDEKRQQLRALGYL